jgi:hypothetical protein
VSGPSPGARVVDVRYGRYEGERRGRVVAVVALARASALLALGKRRGWLAKALPIGLTVVAFMPAFVVLGVRALFADRIRADLSEVLPYRGYFSMISVIMLAFSTLVVPELVCPDRRDRVLDLYFSTAVSRVEYVTAKILAALAPMAIVTLCPVLFLYVGNVLFAVHPLGYFQDHAGDLVRVLAAGLEIALYYALLSLAVASLTNRASFAIGGYLGLMVLSGAASSLLVDGLGAGQGFNVLALPFVPIAVAQKLFRDTENFHPGWGAWTAMWAAVCIVSLAVLAIRYRRRA